VITSIERQQLLWLTQRIASDEARTKLAEVLYEVMTESTQFGPCDLPAAEDREWIRGAMAIPIQAATEAALELLAWSTAQAISHGPDGLLTRLERSHCGEEFGRQ
jgi:hypothetical protein